MPRVRAAALAALIGLGILLWPAPGLAQTRVGSTVVVSAGGASECARSSDVALDTTNNAYLVVWGSCGIVKGRFVAMDGTPLGTAPFIIPTTAAFTQAPRVAFSPEAGVFLVIWYDNRDNANIPQVYGRTLSYQSSGIPSFPGTDFNISQVDTTIGVNFNMDPGVGYSSGSQTFLVAYCKQFNIIARRVSTTGSVGSEIAVTTGGSSSAGSWAPDIAYNALADEFYVAWKYFIDPGVVGIRGRRVTAATGALPDTTWLGIDSSSDDYGPPVPVFDPTNNRYLVGWFRGYSGVPTTFGQFVSASGALYGSRFTIASQGAHFSLGLARSAVTGTYLAAFNHSTILEIYGTEVTAAGVAGALTALTSTSAWQDNGIDYARAAASASQAQWLVSANLPFASPSRAVGQRVAPTFGKSSPATGVADLSTTVTLIWQSTGATLYEYCVDTTNDRSCNGGWQSAGTSTTIDVPKAAGTYYWQVRATVGGSTTEADTGTWWNFTVGARPAAPVFSKTAPTNGSSSTSTSATLTWGAVTGAGFEVCVDTTNDSACGTTWQWNSTATSLALSSLAVGTYYWQVRAVTSVTTQADGGTWWSFTVSPGSALFNKTAPSAGATVGPANLVFLWTVASGATSYSVCIDTVNDDSCNPLSSGGITGNWIGVGNVLSWQPSYTFVVGTTYYWQVRTIIGSPIGADNNAWFAFTVSSTPTFTDPTLTARTTVVKAVHITELRQAIATLRTRYSLSAVSWTNATLTSGATPVKAVHVTELRTALNAVYTAAGRTLPTYTDQTFTAGVTAVKALHIAELRTAVAAIW